MIEVFKARLRALKPERIGFWIVLSVAAVAGAIVAVSLTLTARYSISITK